MPVFPLKRLGVDPNVADWARQFETDTELNCAYVTVELAATIDVQQVPHGLGRAYRYASLAGQSPLDNYVTVGLPKESTDPRRFVPVRLAYAEAATILLRVS